MYLIIELIFDCLRVVLGIEQKRAHAQVAIHKSTLHLVPLYQISLSDTVINTLKLLGYGCFFIGLSIFDDPSIGQNFMFVRRVLG